MRGNFITDRNGINNPNYKDGRKKTRLYRIYRNVLTRCYNSNSAQFHYYGGRNISVCDEWLNDFKSFYDWSMSHGYNDTLTIDRIDNTKGYSPDNCRWVTMQTQSINRRNNHFVTLHDECKPLCEWCEIYNINYKTVRDRLKRGWDYEKALITPVDVRFRKKVVV